MLWVSQQLLVLLVFLFKTKKTIPDDLPLFSLPHLAQIYQKQEASGSRLQKEILYPEQSC